ncbi:metal ABC transporter permease [bacterium]|nr:metal ABC transporter permease [bacterium]
MIELLTNLFTDYTLRTVALGSGLLGIVSGALGSYAVLRRQSLLGDAISHAALPGIGIAFLLTGSKSPIILLLGAIVAGWFGTIQVMSIVRHTRIKEDTALGIVLSVFFGFGLVILTFIQKMPNASQAGLDKYLFGQAATLIEQDVWVMAGLGVPALLLMGIFWKEFKLLSFDPDYGASLGMPIRVMDILLTTLIVVAIAIGLQTVGVVLMSAMIVAPAAAARQWTDRLGTMVGLSAFFGAISGVVGSIISSAMLKMPTGPTIVLVMSAIAIFSLLFAPNRGVVWTWLRMRSNHRQLQVKAVLEDLYILAQQHENREHAHPIGVLKTMSNGHGGVDRSLEELESQGLAKKVVVVGWALTPKGFDSAHNEFDSESENVRSSN